MFWLWLRSLQLHDKDSSESAVTKSYKIKFIDKARYMASTISNRRNSQN